jgi:transcription termination/antitermination protein NusG
VNDQSIQDSVTDDADQEPSDVEPGAPEESATPDETEVEEATEERVGAEDPPAVEVLEARIEVDEESERSSDLDAAATIPETEEEQAEAGEETVEESEADALREPDEESVSEALPEVAEELEETPAVSVEIDQVQEEDALAAEAADAAALAAETAEPEPEQPAAAVEEAPEAAPETAPEGAPEEEQVPLGRDPFRGPGDWYVVHTYAGYENKVRANLESRISSMQMQDKIFDVEIPMEDVMEIKGGKKQVVQKKVFPGYLLVKMVYDNDSWYVVRNTPGVTGFVSSGTGTKPTPLSKREVEKILAVKQEEVKPTFRLEFEEGDVVRIISGPFADFNGTVDEINVDQSKLKVLVNIFDRETPVELGFDQVAKV